MSKSKSSGSGFASAILFISLLYFFGNQLDKQEVTVPEETPYHFENLSMDSHDIDEMVRALENEFDVQVEEDKKDEFVLLYSIFQNPNLTSDEKNTFYGYYSIILDNPYLNREEAYRSLSKVKIEYSKRDDDIADNVQGLYQYGDQTIRIFEKDDLSKSILLHEGIHCIFTNSYSADLPIYFTEGMTELLVNEYFSYDPFYEGTHYPYEVAYIKMLNELVGSDLVLKAFSKGDFSIITNEMEKYNSTPYSSFKILNIYEDAFLCNDKNYEFYFSKEEQENAYHYLEKIYSKRNSNISNKDFQYFHEITHGAFSDNPSLSYAEYVVNHGILEKAYFSTDLKSQFSRSILKDVNNRDKVLVHSFSSKFDK